MPIKFAQPLSREELIDIFWHSDAPQILAFAWSIARIMVVRNESMFRVTPKMEPLDPAAAVKIETTEVEFYLEGHQFGEEVFAAVMCERKVIIPPFPLLQREQIPTMYRKEGIFASPSSPRRPA